MITAKLTEREAAFLLDVLDNVQGLKSFDPSIRVSLREMIYSIQGKLQKGA